MLAAIEENQVVVISGMTGSVGCMLAVFDDGREMGVTGIKDYKDFG